MKSLFRHSFIALIVLAASGVTYSNGNHPIEQDNSIRNTGLQAPELLKAPDIINSFSDLEAYISAVGIDRGPLSKFTEVGLKEFVSSLTFTELGLGSLSYRILETELTPEEAYSLMALFGLENIVFDLDFDRIESPLDRAIQDSNYGHSRNCPLIANKQCVIPASCAPQESWICITCNCGIQTP